MSDTIPSLDTADTEPPPPLQVIEAGHAQAVLSGVLAELLTAYRRLEATGHAIARALDETATR